MNDFANEIDVALNANVELSKEEYAKNCANADESTKTHGVEGRAPLSEATRHKRVQTNFYATALNILVNIYQLQCEIADSLKELNNARNKNE